MELKANEQGLIDQLKTSENLSIKESQVIEETTKKRQKSQQKIISPVSPSSQVTEKNLSSQKSPQEIILTPSSPSPPEITFIDPSEPQLPVEIKEEADLCLKITEVHASYGIKEIVRDDLSSDEWPEEKVPDPPKKKRKPDTRKNRIRRPKGAPPIVRQSKYPELDEEIKNLPDTKNGKVNCSKCSKEVFKKFYRKHMVAVHFRNLTCDRCGRKFISRSSIEDHMNQHMGIKPYTCPFNCGASFGHNTSKYIHIKIHHTQRENPVFICEICACKFKSKNSLKVTIIY